MAEQQKGLGTNAGGGVVTPKPMSYDKPKPSGGSHPPKIHNVKGTNHGTCGTQGKH